MHLAGARKAERMCALVCMVSCTRHFTQQQSGFKLKPTQLRYSTQYKQLLCSSCTKRSTRKGCSGSCVSPVSTQAQPSNDGCNMLHQVPHSVSQATSNYLKSVRKHSNTHTRHVLPVACQAKRDRSKQDPSRPHITDQLLDSTRNVSTA